MDYKQEIPTAADIKILEELKKYPNLHAALKQQPVFLLDKINKVIKAFYS
jgi:hypothetical protein